MGKKYNEYDLSGEYGIGKLTNSEEVFYFDLQDYDKIRKYCWRLQVDKRNGYKRVVTSTHPTSYTCKILTIWKAITGYSYCEHKNRNTLDNRRSNLRPSNHKLNMQNKSLYKSNQVGFTGIEFSPNGHYVSSIRVNNRQYVLGTFKTLEMAIYVRVKAEAGAFDLEYAPSRELFSKYDFDFKKEQEYWKWWITQSKINYLGESIYYQRVKVIRIDQNGEKVVFGSLKEAIESLCLKDTKLLKKCCNGELDIFKGYKWRYYYGEKKDEEI